ncbi:MAG: amino acid ABC transporter ATP-binding protein, partial [Clostridia bacterium]|nr:amino acid ABC transporter ATP-binding protein [Clostridia bacterium]
MADKNVIISVKNLEKKFDDTSVLKGVSVDINKGDVVCVIGASGSGKSTFLRCLNLLE